MTHPGSRSDPLQALPPLGPDDVARVVGSPLDPGFVTRLDGMVIWWSPALLVMTGVAQDLAVGRPCWEVLRGANADGTFRCEADCPILALARQGRGSGTALVRVPSSVEAGSNAESWVQVVLSTIVLRDLDGLQIALFHWVEPVSHPYAGVPARPSMVERTGRGHRLTSREQEVLELLTLGRTTDEICSELRLHRSTVRNHIQGILEKLDVPTRSAAIVKALRSGN